MPLPEEILNEVDEQYRSSPALEQINTVGDLAKSFVETKAMVGNSLGRAPDKDAGPDAWQAWANSLIEKTDGKVMLKPDFTQEEQTQEFYRTIGKPEKMEDYENPEDSSLDDGTAAQLRELGFKHNLTKAQMKGFMSDLSGLQKQTLTNLEEARTLNMKSLQDEWGMAAEARIEAAHKVLEEFPDGRSSDNLTPSEIKALYKVHTSLTGKGAQVHGQKGAEPDGRRTPEEAILHFKAVLKRVSENKEGLDTFEIDRLTKAAMKVAVEEGGMDGDLNSLRAGVA